MKVHKHYYFCRAQSEIPSLQLVLPEHALKFSVIPSSSQDHKIIIISDRETY